MCWSLYCGWPVPLISLWHHFFSLKNSLRLCVDRCIVDDLFLFFPCGILSFLWRTVYVHMLIVVLWMTTSSYFFAASFLFFEEQSTFMCWRCIVDDQFLLFPCGILSPLRRTVYVYVLIVVLWMTISSYFLVASFLFFEEQSTFMCWSLYCGWPFPLISLWHPFFSSKNSVRLCVDRSIVDDKFILFPSGILSFFEEQSTYMCWSLYCGWPVPLISLWHPFFSSKNSLHLCVDRCIVDDLFHLFPCGIISFLRRTVYVYELSVVLWMTSSSYFLAASFLFFEEQSTFMCWSLYCGWPVPLISLRHPFFFSKNSLRLCVDRCIVDDQFLLFPCGILSFFRRTVNVYVLIVVLWMTSSSYFLAASFLFFEEQSTFMCWSLYCGWPVPLISLRHPFFSSKNSQRLCVDRCIVDDQFLLFPCGILSFLRRTEYVYVLIVALWMTSSSYFLAASFLFFEEQSTFMCWSLYCGWPVPLISSRLPFFSSKNSLRLCADRCIVDDQLLLFPCGILSFFEEQSTFMCWSLYCR